MKGRPKGSYGPTAINVEAQLSQRHPRKTSWIARAVGISVDHCGTVLRWLKSQERAERINQSGEGLWISTGNIYWGVKKPEIPTKARQWWQI